ncbi:MAG: hypothetical protein IVW54_08440 [Candidatus Binataceae bacterium]|nr:hypothetical protein [Candidatus Binataceae bacterium]
MALHLLLGLLASTFFALGLVMMKSRGAALPEASGRHFASAAISWCRDPIWLGGIGLQTAGYAIYLFALANAPISLIAVMMQGGIGLFILFAVIFLGERASSAEWTGVMIVVLAMAAVAISVHSNLARNFIDPHALILLTLGGVLLGALLSLADRLSASGAALALASGIAFGFGSLYAKALTDAFLRDPGAPLWVRALDNPYIYLAIVANLIGLVTLQNAFHRARGIIAMPLSSAVSNLLPIVGGILAFGEHLPRDPRLAALRIAAFALTIVAGALLAGAASQTAKEAPAGDTAPAG